jgi:hypothetical protein
MLQTYLWYSLQKLFTSIPASERIVFYHGAKTKSGYWVLKLALHLILEERRRNPTSPFRLAPIIGRGYRTTYKGYASTGYQLVKLNADGQRQEPAQEIVEKHRLQIDTIVYFDDISYTGLQLDHLVTGQGLAGPIDPIGQQITYHREHVVLAVCGNASRTVHCCKYLPERQRAGPTPRTRTADLRALGRHGSC